MKTFKQHLKTLEKERKSKGYFPVVVHGSHASEKYISGKFPNVVHGSHASKEEKLKEENSNDYVIYDKSKSHIDALNDYETRNHKELEKHYSDLRDHPDSRNITKYTSTSKGLNKALISGEDLNEDYKERVKGIDNILNNSKPLPQKTTVFSGLGFNPKHHVDDDGHIVSPAYLSTSTRGEMANTFASHLDDEGKPTGGMGGKTINSHVLKIDLPEGSSHGAYIDHLSEHRGEDEFLIKRGTKFKIHPVPEIREEDNFRSHIWHATPAE